MVWFRRSLEKEIDILIKKIGIETIKLNRDWNWTRKKLNDLQDLEETDLELLRRIQYIAQYTTEPSTVEKIHNLAQKLKERIQLLISLHSLPNISDKKLDLAHKTINQLTAILQKNITEGRIYKGMTREQAERLGIEIESFYVVAGERLKKCILGKGEWPREWNRANVGVGLYTWNDFEEAITYKKKREDQIKKDLGKTIKLDIYQITFPSAVLKRFRNEGLEFDLRTLSDKEREQWMDDYSTYSEKLQLTTVKPETVRKPFWHKFFHVIQRRAHGVEHYFRPECLNDAVIEKIA